MLPRCPQGLTGCRQVSPRYIPISAPTSHGTAKLSSRPPPLGTFPLCWLAEDSLLTLSHAAALWLRLHRCRVMYLLVRGLDKGSVQSEAPRPRGRSCPEGAVRTSGGCSSHTLRWQPGGFSLSPCRKVDPAGKAQHDRGKVA